MPNARQKDGSKLPLAWEVAVAPARDGVEAVQKYCALGHVTGHAGCYSAVGSRVPNAVEACSCIAAAIALRQATQGGGSGGSQAWLA